jgi:hypothetical protein
MRSCVWKIFPVCIPKKQEIDESSCPLFCPLIHILVDAGTCLAYVDMDKEDSC